MVREIALVSTMNSLSSLFFLRSRLVFESALHHGAEILAFVTDWPFFKRSDRVL